jgi:2-dehydropantoate 2-reductase
MKFEITSNIEKSRWQKLLWNGTFNTLCAATDLDFHSLFECGCEDLIRKVMYEIWQVGLAALGSDESWVPKAQCDRLVAFTKGLPRNGFLPSTLQDVRRGVEIEYEALCGNAVRVAHRHGVAVPNLEMLYSMLKATNFRIKQSKRL